MTVQARRLIAAVALAAFLALWAIGIVPTACDRAFLPSLLALLVFLGLLVRRRGGDLLARMALLFLSVAGALVAADLVLRLRGEGLIYYRPDEAVFDRRPDQPLVYRYKPHVNASGTTFGDLAAMTGDESLREPRQIVFRTDEFGFRNDPAEARDVYDVIVLGDSFGVGTGTTQDAIWPRVLAGRYGLRVYNLCIMGSPWQSLMNLRTEFARLGTHPGTIVLLALFSGNDLDDLYGPDAEISDAPWKNALEAVGTCVEVFRNRSAVKQLVQQRFLWYVRTREQGAERKAAGVHVAESPSGKPVLFQTTYAKVRHRTRDEVLQHPHYVYLRNTILRILELCQGRSAVLKIAMLPTKSEVYGWILDGSEPWSTDSSPSGFSSVIADLCSERGIPYLDLKPGFVEASRGLFEGSGTLLWWRDDTHWSEAGHALAAELIHDHLLKPKD